MENNTSDALQHPPSFEQMVGLIKKLFTDYLEDVMKTPPSEIGKAWERYKTLNHLYQQPKGPMPHLDEPLISDDELKAWEKGEKVTGPVWVKGAPKEAKECFGKVQSVLHDDKHYDAVISPIANTDHWWAVGKDFKFSVHKDKIIEHLDETGNAYQELPKIVTEALNEAKETINWMWQHMKEPDGQTLLRVDEFNRPANALHIIDLALTGNAPAKLTQANADLIREANNRDLGDKPGEGKE